MGTGSRRVGFGAEAAVYGDDLVRVGSMNDDSRSTERNTGMGLVVESVELAREERAAPERDLDPRSSRRVALDEDGDLARTCRHEERRVRPNRGARDRPRERLEDGR